MDNTPTRIGEFDVIRQIGTGGMGDVYLGRDIRLDRQVAIKVVRGEVRDQDVLDRFFREARSAAALRHPNIVTIYASGQHIRQPYMVMEFVDGESLAEIIRQRRTLTLSEKLSYLEQICAGLHYAHQAGIVHRDVKPANIMVDRQGVVRVLDFGIARIEGSAMTLDGTMVGSLNYMSPEQMLGSAVDHRSDMFSFGSVAYELLCYQQAFKGGINDGLLQRLPKEDPAPLTSVRDDIPPELEAIVSKALQKTPAKRYPDMEALREELLGVTQGLDQDDVRTILVRPRLRAVSDSRSVVPPPPSSAAAGPTSAATSDTLWGGARAEVPDTKIVPPAWAIPLPTRIVKTPASGDTTQPLRQAITSRATHVPATPLPPLPLPPARPQSARRGVLVGTLVGIGVIVAMMTKPWETTPPPTPLEREQPAIEATLERFRTAYRTRDMEAMNTVFPSMSRDTNQAMQRTFDRCLVYDVTVDGIQVSMDPVDETLARAEVRSSHTCTPKTAERQTTIDRRDLVTLRKDGDAWLVSQIATVPQTPTGATQ